MLFDAIVANRVNRVPSPFVMGVTPRTNLDGVTGYP